MGKRSREILALCLLVVLGIAVAGAMAFYIVAGHNWNKAASHIDDLVGSMDGYTVILFEGTHPEPAAESSKSASKKAAGKASSSSSATSKGSDVSASSATSEKAATSSASTERDASASSATSSGRSVPKSMDEHQLAKEYRAKGATTLIIRSDDPASYLDPMVIQKNGVRYGICAALGTYRYVEVRDKAKELKAQGADFVVIVTDSVTIETGWLRDIDVVIMCRTTGKVLSQRTVGSALCVDAPYVGQLQAVVIAPSGVITTRTIEVD